MFYKTVFDTVTGFPNITQAIKIDSDLNVQLQSKGCSVPLPTWLVKGRSANLTRFSMLENIPSYLNNVVAEHPTSILEEIRKRQMYKPKGRPPYSPEVIRYSLLLRYTSPQAYKLLLEQFPLPSFSFLRKLQQGESYKSYYLIDSVRFFIA